MIISTSLWYYCYSKGRSSNVKKEFNQLVFSSSDLVYYDEAPFASLMESLCLEQPATRPFTKQFILTVLLYAEIVRTIYQGRRK
jgi:hypothetical protein